MRLINISTITFLIVLKIKIIAGDNITDVSKKNGVTQQQGSETNVDPNNITNQEQTTTNDSTLVSKFSTTNKQIQSNELEDFTTPTSSSPVTTRNNDFSSEKTDSTTSTADLTSSSHPTNNDLQNPSTHRPSHENLLSDQTSGLTIKNTTSQNQKKDTSTQDTSSKKTTSTPEPKDKLEIFNVTTRRINSSCIDVAWEINQPGNFTFNVEHRKFNYFSKGGLNQTVCNARVKPGKKINIKIQPYSEEKEIGDGKKHKAYFEPSSPVMLNYNNLNRLSWKKGPGLTDHYELRYQTNNSQIELQPNATEFELEEFISGEVINISLYSVKYFKYANKTLKSEPAFKEITIAPLPPVIDVKQNIDSIDILLQSGTSYRDGYNITINSNDTLYNVNRSYIDTSYNYTITNLTPAQNYNISIVSISNGVDSQPATINTSTCPQIHKVIIKNVTSTSFVIHWDGDYNNDTVIEIRLNDKSYSAQNTDQRYIDNLNSTTNYSVEVAFYLNGCNASNIIYGTTKDAYLKPIEDWKCKSNGTLLQLYWKPPINAKNTVKYYVVSINYLNSDTIDTKNTTTDLIDFNSNYGECYNITIAGVNNAGRGENFTQYVYIPEDVPENVTSFRTTNITSRSVSIHWNKPEVFKGMIVKYTVDLYNTNNKTTEPVSSQILLCDSNCYESKCLNNTRQDLKMVFKAFNRSEDKFEVDFENLTPYHNYTAEITAYTRDNNSEPVQIQFSTKEDRPGKINNTVIKFNANSSDATIIWKPPTEQNGVILSYHIELLNRNITAKRGKNTTTTSVSFANLHQVTEYSVQIKARTSKGYGKPSTPVNFTTDFAELSLIQDFQWSFQKERNEVKISWKKPDNGIDGFFNYSVEILNLNNGKMQIKEFSGNYIRFNVTYGDCYNITIAGVNNAGRGETFTEYIHIPEDVPEKVTSVRTTNITSRSVSIHWKKPEVFKGMIVKYTVDLYNTNNKTTEPVSSKIFFCDSSCYESKCLNNTRQDKTMLVKPFNRSEDKFEVDFENLTPHHNYTAEITAYTRDNNSEPVPIQFSTKEDRPGKINNTAINIDANSSDATIIWKPPTEPNGVILSYYIELFSRNNTLIQNKNTTTTSVSFANLQQVTEYYAQIKARTSKGYGNFSESVRFSTQLKVPSKPENVIVKKLNPTSVRVSWNQPTNDLNISHYIQVNDTESKTEFKKQHCGHQVSTCIVNGLKEYWNYSLQINVENNEGESSSEIVFIQTLEDKPGKVASFEARPESYVYNPRSIWLEWKPPNKEDKNGKITNYVISYGRDHMSLKEIVISLPVTNYILSDIVTDVQYHIQIAAVTKVGRGVDFTRKVTVPSGILPKPFEDIPLIKHLPEHPVQEKQHQIPIQIPLNFLCNISYGDIVTRGILATRGTRSIMQEGISRVKYPSWYETKDSKTLLTYQVSSLPSLWNCKQEEGNKVFIVGNDKQCEGKEKYCNGYLLPDTIYRFKVYVCTKAGCTYSRYSYPIKTDKESSTMLVVIIVGVLIACIIPAIIAFMLYRQKKACFALSDGDGEKNSLDLRVYKTNRNRPVKLLNFEGHVQAYHLNTNFGFSEEYKVVKQLSPKYATKAAERESCRIKNRYTNVLPFDYTRVKLLPVDDEEDSEYINANYLPGYNGKREYIAAQGPLPSTTDDFWRMLWENQVSVVVMLTQCMEKGRVKCEKYWPDSPDPVYYGDLVVQLRSESNLPDYNIRVLDIKLGMKSRTIKQFHFLKWPDFGCPEKTWLLLNFVTAVRAHLSNSPTGPSVVHCSAGVGRTGTFIATDMLLQQIHDSEEIDIFGLVLDMRENRSLMVQTENQYIYIHDCIRDALIDDTDEEESVENIYENEGIYENT